MSWQINTNRDFYFTVRRRRDDDVGNKQKCMGKCGLRLLVKSFKSQFGFHINLWCEIELEIL